MPKFPTDRLPRVPVYHFLPGAQRPCHRPAGGRRLPSGQLFVTSLRIRVTQTVHFREPGIGGVLFVGAKTQCIQLGCDEHQVMHALRLCCIAAAGLLQSLVHQRYKLRRSIVTTSNRERC